MAAQPGWYPDPEDPTRWRWWDGVSWGAAAAEQTSAEAPGGAVPWLRRLPIWAWAAIAAVAVLLTFLLPQLVAFIALAVLIIAIVALWRGTPTWLRIPSRKAAAAVTAVSAVALVVTSGIASAQVPPTTSLTSVAETAHSEESSAPRPFADAGESTPTPERTPITSVREEVLTEALPFQEVTVDDPAMNRGETAVRSEGANGERQLTYRVTLVDGEEVSRELIGDGVSVEPVDRVIAVGTYDPPPPPPAQPEPAPLAQAGAGCDSNYADACVPVASDVDCAGGSGNGPAYFDGVARIVGSDIYDLDRDGDGYACEP